MARSAPEVAAEFDVGERLRTLRRFRRCTLQTVAARSGLSESFLSQVERGRSNASIASLRRIADALGVFPGLVSHYFPSVDYLVAEAFADVMTQDRNETFAMIEAAAPAPLARMREFLRYMLSDDRDRISLLWLDAWHGARQRPALQVALVAQMQAWESRLAALVQEGAATGEFRTADALLASTRILAAVDGLTVAAAIKSAINNSDVGDLVIATAERELGLRPGQLRTAAQ